MSVRAVVERGVARLFVELRMFCGPSRVYSGQPLLFAPWRVSSLRIFKTPSQPQVFSQGEISNLLTLSRTVHTGGRQVMHALWYTASLLLIRVEL